jgi:hypothetical protein
MLPISDKIKSLVPTLIGFAAKAGLVALASQSSSPNEANALLAVGSVSVDQLNSFLVNISSTYFTNNQQALAGLRNQDTERLLAAAWRAALVKANLKLAAGKDVENQRLFQLWDTHLESALWDDDILRGLFWSHQPDLPALRSNLAAGEPNWPLEFESLLRFWALDQIDLTNAPPPIFDPNFMASLAAALPDLFQHELTHLLRSNQHEKAYKGYVINLLERIPGLITKVETAAFQGAYQGATAALKDGLAKGPHLPSTHFNVPAPPTHFTGRKEILEQIRKSLETKGAAALTALHGQGGIGKSSLAKQYAHDHRDKYQLVWWFNAANSTTLSNSYSQLAQTAQLPDAASYTAEQTFLAVQDWLHNKAPKPALLIFDNAPHPQDLQAHRQSYPATHILITSRDPNWGSFAEPIELSLFTRDEARDFLLARCNSTDAVNAELLARDLGYLPLALDHAAAYIGNRRKSIAEYRQIFAEKAHRLVDEGYPETGYPHSLYQSFRLSFDAMEEESPAAAQLLELFAFFAPDQFPREVLASSATALPPPLDRICADSYDGEKLLGAAHSYSLLSLSEETLSLHRLTQLALRHHLHTKAATQTTLFAVIAFLNAAFPYDPDEVESWQPSSPIAPHALSAVRHAQSIPIPDSAAPDDIWAQLTRLLNQLALFFKNWQGDLPLARTLAERALAIDEATFGPHHPTVAIRASNLAQILQAQGDLPQARTLTERSLAINEATFGPHHPNVAISASNLATILKAQGDLPQARTLAERALAIDEATFGPHHPTVAIRASNLAQILKAQGDLPQARTLTERALAIAHATFGPDNPTTKIYAANLAAIPPDDPPS